MLLGTTQTVTALKTFNTGTFALRNPANTFSYNFLGSAIVANRNVTLPLLTGNDTFTMNAFAQTLTNKTINFSNNTLTNVMSLTTAQSVTAGIKKTFTPNATNAGIRTVGVTTNPSTLVAGDLWYRSDTEKYTYRGTSVARSLVAENLAQTLTNKTLALSANTISGTKTQYNTSLTDGTFLFVGDIDSGTDDFVTGATFNTTDGVLTLTRQSGSTVTVDLDNRYSLTGHTHSGFVDTTGTPADNQIAVFTDANTIEGDGNLTYNGTSLQVTAGFLISQNTGAGANLIANVTDGGAASLKAGTGQQQFKFDSGFNFAISEDTKANILAGTGSGTNRMIIEKTTGYVGINEASPNQFLTIGGTISLKEQASANTDTATYGQIWVKSDSPNTLWFTNDVGTDVQLGTGSGTDDYVTGATFNTGDGVITSTRQSGGTYTVDIDGRYLTSVTGGVGISSSGGLTPSLALTVDELSEKSGALVGTDRLVGTTSTTNWAETISGIPLSIFNNDSGWTSNAGTVTNVNNGNGMNFTNITSSGTVTLGTPTTNLSSTSTNAVTTSSHTHAIDTGIANTNIVKIDSASVATNEYARFTASGLESRSNSEVLSDIGAQASGNYVTTDTTQTISGTKSFSGTYTKFYDANTSLAIHMGAATGMTVGGIPCEIMAGNSPLIAGSLNIQPRGGGVGFVSFWNNGTEDMRFTAAGNLGIGGNFPIPASFRLSINDGTIGLKERTSAAADVAGYGQIWVSSGTTPNTLWFTNDVGTDVQLGLGGNVTKVGTPVNKQIGVWTGDGTIEGDANFVWDGLNLVFTGITSGDNTVIKFNNASGRHSGMSVYDGGAAGSFPFIGSNLYLSTGALTRYSSSLGSSGMLLRPTGVIDWYTGSGLATNTMSLSAVGVLTTGGFVKTGGLSTQFLKADGSVDSTTYGTGTVTSVTGGDGILSSGGATPDIDLHYSGASNFIDFATENVDIKSSDFILFESGTGGNVYKTAASNLFSGGSGTVTSVTFGAGTGIDITGTNPITTSGTATITVDLSEMPDMGVTNMVGTDELIVLDSSVQKRKALNDIQLSLFDDDLTYIASVSADTTPQLGGDLDVNGNDILFAAEPTNNTSTGIKIRMTTSGLAGVTRGNVCYLTGANPLHADADSASNMPGIFLALETLGTSTEGDFLLYGTFTNTSWAWTAGDVLYVSNTAGSMTHTPPSGTGDVVQAVGVAITADTILFNPSYNLTTIV